MQTFDRSSALDSARSLIDSYGSPLYVYDGEELTATIDRITRSIAYPATRFYFACVTNGNVNLIEIFDRSGWGLHGNTPGDIYLGLQAQIEPSRIIYSGSNLDRQQMQELLDWGIITFNLDSISQLELLCDLGQQISSSKPLRLGLRLNLPELTGDSRIGVMPAEFDRGVDIAARAGLKIAGLHFYRGTGTNATAAFTTAIDRVIEVANLLPDWQYLDFGGGFGYPYHRDGAAFDWSEFGDVLTRKLTALDRQIDLAIEPGRAAIAGCGTLLTQVVSIKWQGEKQIVGVDTTVGNLSVPSVHGGYRQIMAIDGRDNDSNYLTDVCGNTTYSRDYLGKNCQLPRLKIGDILAILDVGAYGYAMSSHFLHCPRPAEVLIDRTGIRSIRERETYRNLL
jgi:diaminopimelate decarboxylase